MSGGTALRQAVFAEGASILVIVIIMILLIITMITIIYIIIMIIIIITTTTAAATITVMCRKQGAPETTQPRDQRRCRLLFIGGALDVYT